MPAANHAGSIEVDVAVLGAGPAAATFALNLAPFCRVILLDKPAPAPARHGESLPAAAARLLRDMGLWDAFQTQAYAPCHVHRSAWGAPGVMEQDTLRNLDGHGWYLERTRFDRWLLTEAQRRGAALLQEVTLAAQQRTQSAPLTADRHETARDQRHWQLQLMRKGRPLQLNARLLVDGSGRGAVLAQRLGAKRIYHDRLVCGWMVGHDRHPSRQGGSEVHAEPNGWWYSAPLPGQNRLLAFYTDADLPAAKSAHSIAGLLQRLPGTPALQTALATEGFAPGNQHGFCAAHGATLDDPAGDGWLAIGDAALAFDPLSAQGVFNALYTGLAGAEAALRWLQSEPGALGDYRSALARIGNAYARHQGAWYSEEQRWPHELFWRRRQAHEQRTHADTDASILRLTKHPMESEQ